MRKKLFCLTVCLLLGLVFTSCGESSDQVESSVTTLETTNVTTSETVTDEDAIRYLIEGKFDLIESMDTDTDAKKVAYALAVLGTSIKSNFLEKIGSDIIPGDDELFEVYGFRDEDSDEVKEEIEKNFKEVTLSEWRESVASLVESIDEAINKLDEVSDTVDFTIPSEFMEDKIVHVDKGSFDALKGLLLAKKAYLEYFFTYDWGAYDDVTDENATLPYLEMVNPIEISYLTDSKNDLENALKYFQNAAKYEAELPVADYKQTLFYYLTEADNQSEIGDFANTTLNQIIDSLSGGTVIEALENRVLNLSYIFDNPIDGGKIEADVDSGMIKEVKVCSGVYSDWDENLVCYDYEREIWFKEGSYFYDYLKGISPDVKFSERESGWYTVSENEYWDKGEITTVYPN